MPTAMLFLLALTQDADKAKALYADMCSTVMDAWTVQVDYKCENKSGGKSAQGKLLMAPGDSFYHKFETRVGDQPETAITIISDGQTVKYGDKPPQTIPAGMVKNWKGIVSVLGLSTHFFNKNVRNVTADAKDFALGRRDGDLQAVSYTIDIGRSDVSLRTTVWIDTRTKLPVRRSTKVKSGADETELTDNYSTFKVGDRIDSKWFAVPK